MLCSGLIISIVNNALISLQPPSCISGGDIASLLLAGPPPACLLQTIPVGDLDMYNRPFEITEKSRLAQFFTYLFLKGHVNEADFLGFFLKLVPHRSLTLPFKLFRFWLQIRGDIRNRKTTPRLGDSPTRVEWLVTLRLGESALNV